MFKKWFGKQQPKEETITAPLDGTIVPLEDVPDPVFAQNMMGDGIAIDPADGDVVAPVDGEIVQLFPTKHAIGLRSEAGVELLIHVGIDTVSMNGEGFTAYVKAGDRVKRGDRLLSVDLPLVREKAKSAVTPIIITNGDALESLEKKAGTSAAKGETVLFHVKMK
ncbi:PTS glucose transporter subunit IIA [Geobacillus thermoleovorans]|uniref:PTS system glucose-specific IIA component n=1 Tax=Geobacillus stearothermophilus TaxID=1422 RepID=A0ABQ7HKA9_GEOSE|nr:MULTISPECIES: PTS glucose transporter subunit IIA [Geobacillus]AMV12584.1 PTS glucose transporter subunit IIA [Geobacillus thermoleovorans]STO35957.1 Glucose-specific phosphotransferase enzyme IIA component [[Flavobacterium] thermophilum]KAF6512615.1 PTS system glucose-specific IIA component [Geobacillus stearothermophilus]PJW13630.1 PTS glucose transporter subunit IIA [Geobacillus sp. Manikaran-105]PJW16777.1 PTS glucose transporter subunit IIA [Geobacillus sp. WSUCF-018B]